MIEETLKLKCEKCGVDYEKPIEYKEWSEKPSASSVFFKWSLAYCDECRRERELQALKNLPKIIQSLTEEPNESL